MAELKKKVLAVDDEPSILAALKEILDEKFEFYSAKDGKQAIESMDSVKPDLIIMDVIMPEMDGFETVKQMRLSARAAVPPVIFLSARSSRAEVDQGLKLSGLDYITKPFSPSKLVKKIDEVFERLEIRKKLSKRNKRL